MKFVSTRGGAPVDIVEAIRRGAAADGGLYLPETIPQVGLGDPDDLPAFAVRLLMPFFAGSALEAEIGPASEQAFATPPLLVTPDADRPHMLALELFHGPTGAFKDYGAQFLLALLDGLGSPTVPLTVLVATSGDTGGAVGCAAEGRSGVQALILFPKGRVSGFQQRQLTCWDEPVRAATVAGDFDDCQRLVKQAFATPGLAAQYRLTSANSINIGRLLPQAAYLAAAATRVFRDTGEKPGLIVPTGNLGHGFAALLARAMGVPIGPVVLATNANPALSEWHATGHFEPRPSIPTIANAMDVGVPSNFERLQALGGELAPVSVERVDDDAIRARIRSEYAASGYVWDPHGATAAEAFARLSEKAREERPWILCATAHPYKFADVVEPLIGRAIEPTPALAAIAGRTTSCAEIAPSLDSLAGLLDGA